MSDSVTGRRVFISYARSDRQRIDALASSLRGMGCPVWFDEELVGGQSWWGRIRGEIRSSDVVIHALSPASLASDPVRIETGYAGDRGISVVLVLVATRS